jgi:guanylate kinase
VSSEGRRKGIPLVIAAPSGTGKTTVCSRIVADDPSVVFSVSHTTRTRRDREADGEDYHFVTQEEFQALVDSGEFLEWAVYNGNRYGTSEASIDASLAEGLDVLLEIEVQGARQVKARRDDARLVFLLPPSMKILEERLSNRGTDTPDQVRRRLDIAEQEIEAATDFDYAVVNRDLECCVAEVNEIIAAERNGAIENLLRRFAPGPAVAGLRDSEAGT